MSDRSTGDTIIVGLWVLVGLALLAVGVMTYTVFTETVHWLLWRLVLLVVFIATVIVLSYIVGTVVTVLPNQVRGWWE